MKQNKHLVIVGVALVIVGIACLMWHLANKGVFASILGKKNTGVHKNDGQANSNVPVSTDTFPLRKGSRGNNVKRLQLALNGAIAFLMPARPFLYDGKQRTSIAVDGVWGDETQAAVNWYYMLNKVEVTEAELSRIKGV